MGIIDSAFTTELNNEDIKLLDLNISEDPQVERIKRWFNGEQVAGEVQDSNKIKKPLDSITEAILNAMGILAPKSDSYVLDMDYNSNDELYGAASLVVKSKKDGLLFTMPIIITNYTFSAQEKFLATTHKFGGGNHLYLGENPNDILQFVYVIPEDSILDNEKNASKAMSFSNLYTKYNKYNVSNSDVYVELHTINKIFKGLWISINTNANNQLSYVSSGSMSLLITEVVDFTEVHHTEEVKEVGLYIKDIMNESELTEVPVLIRGVDLVESDVFQQLTGIYGTNNGYFVFGQQFPKIVSVSGIFPVKLSNFTNLDNFKLSDSNIKEEFTLKIIEDDYDKLRINNKDYMGYVVLEDVVYKCKAANKSISINEESELIYSFRMDMVLLDKLTKEEFLNNENI